MAQDLNGNIPLLVADDIYIEPDEFLLKCPNCGEATGIHIDTVLAENASGQKVTVTADGEDNGATLDVSVTGGNPKDGRRHRFTLVGWCEHCPDEFQLSFQQHKGATLFKKSAASRD
jgi:hypothetical protein